MVEYDLIMGEEELEVLKELSLRTGVCLEQRKKAVPSFLILFGACLAIGILNLLSDNWLVGVALLGLSGVFLYYLCGGFKKQQRANITKEMDRWDRSLKEGTRHFTFDKEGIKSVSELGKTEYLWNAFQYWGTFYEYIYLMKVDNQVILIDQDKLSENELEELKRLLENVKKGKELM